METQEDPNDRHRKHIDRIDKTIVALEAERERLARLLETDETGTDMPAVPHER
jgi:hypothetical protein